MKNQTVNTVKVAAILLLLCLGSVFKTEAQVAVYLNLLENKNKQFVDVKLFDNDTGNYLLNLKLTFHITKDKLLFMIVGDENGTNDDKTVWMFDENMDLSELTKRNKNLIPSKEFKKVHHQVEQILNPSGNVDIYMGFQNKYEYVQSVPKPVFFRIKDMSVPVELKLKFYVSETSYKEKYSQILTAEAGTTKVTINIIK